MIDDELRELGIRLRDLNVSLELGLQESARAAVLAGVGATFISRIAIEGDLEAGALAIARVQGLEPARRRPARPRDGARRDAHRAGVRRLRARAPVVIVEWGLNALPDACAAAGVSAPLLVASPRWDSLELPVEPAARWSEVPSDRVPEAVEVAPGL